MTHLGRVLVVFWIAVAIWFSDRWVWPLPALIGVLIGVWISHAQRQHQRKRLSALPPFELGSLLMIASFVYLYVLFLLLGLGRSSGPKGFGLIVGLVVLPLLLIGLIGAIAGKVQLPRWVLKLWDQLLEER